MMSSDLNPEISKCVNNLAEALLNRGQLGAEIQAQKALSILQSKDDKLEVLQNRLNLLEKLAENLEQANNGKMPLEKISEESLLEVETYGAGDGNPKFLQASVPCNLSPKIEQDQGSKDSKVQSKPKSSDLEVEENSFVTHLKLCNLELRKAIDQEIVLRMQEQRQFSQILEHIHKQLQAIKLYSEFPSQINLSPENENMALIVSPRKQNNVNLMQCCGDLGYDTMTRFDINNEDPDKIYSNIETSMGTQRDMRVKFQQIKKDLEEMTLNIRDSHEKISQEQQAQRALQSAWCARFKIQSSKIDRLRKRHRKVQRHFRNGKREIAKLKKQLSDQKENDETNEANEENDQVDVIKTTGLLRGRLDAAHIVMMKQKEQLKQQQEHIEKQYNQIDRLRQRLLRLEANKSAKRILINNHYAELEEQKKLLNNKYSLLEGELHNTKHYLSKIQSQLALVRNDYERVLEENKCYEVELCGKKMTPQNKLLHIPEKLKARESKIKDYESKINLLRGKFTEHSRIATERITTANKKLKEFFKTIEIFLQLAFKHSMSSVYLEAEKIASDILNIGKSADINKVTNLMNNDPKLKDWILQCKYLIAKEKFAEETAQFLYSITCQNFCSK